MKVTLQSTSMITTIGGTKARVWEGETEGGIKCYAAIALIAHHKDDDQRAQEFTQSLAEVVPPSAVAVKVFDMRNVL